MTEVRIPVIALQLRVYFGWGISCLQQLKTNHITKGPLSLCHRCIWSTTGTIKWNWFINTYARRFDCLWFFFHFFRRIFVLFNVLCQNINYSKYFEWKKVRKQQQKKITQLPSKWIVAPTHTVIPINSPVIVIY